MNTIILLCPPLALFIGVLVGQTTEGQQFIQQNLNTVIWFIIGLSIVSVALIMLREFLVQEVITSK